MDHHPLQTAAAWQLKNEVHGLEYSLTNLAAFSAVTVHFSRWRKQHSSTRVKWSIIE